MPLLHELTLTLTSPLSLARQILHIRNNIQPNRYNPRGHGPLRVREQERRSYIAGEPPHCCAVPERAVFEGALFLDVDVPLQGMPPYIFAGEVEITPHLP